MGFFGKSDPTWYNGLDWYVSALLGTSYIIYFLLSKLKKDYAKFYAPIISILLYGYNYTHYTGINSFGFPVGGHIARSIASMNLGVISYGITCSLKNKQLSNANKSVMLFFSTLFYLIGIFLSYDTEKGYLDFLCVILFFIATTLAFSVPISCKLINNRVIYHLSEMTLPIFLNHYFIRFLPRKIFYFVLLLSADIEIITIKIISRHIKQKHNVHSEDVNVKS